VLFGWRAPAREMTRFEIPPPPEQSFGIYLAVSPDGRKVAFTGQGSDGIIRLWVRDLSTLEARLLPGTEIGSGFGSPFWSPDGRFLAYSDGTRLKKVDATGASPPVTITEIRGGAVGLGAWSTAGIIIFGGRGGGPLRQVSENGGTATAVTQISGNDFHAFPCFLPGGREFLYFRTSPDPEVQGVYLGSLDTPPAEQPKERLLVTNFAATYVPAASSATGYILFIRDGTLLAQPFDPSSRKLESAAVPIAEGLGSSNVYGFFSASNNGTLAFRSGAAPGRQLTWVDTQGRTLSTVGPLVPWDGLSLSPDGKRAALSRLEGGNQDIWIVDIERGTSSRFTFDPGFDSNPVWSPDGARVAYHNSSAGRAGIYIKASNGTGQEQLVPDTAAAAPTSWSSDGKYLLASEGNDITVVPLDGGKPFPFVATPFGEGGAVISPDGHWVAYVSSESGTGQLYLRPFAPGSEAAGGQWQISPGAAAVPRWRKDGKALVYRTAPDGDMMFVEVTTGADVRIGAPRRLFRTSVTAPMAASADFERFLIALPQGEATPAPITVVVNWDAALPE
jgi:Tol biopolymer transport system component